MNNLSRRQILAGGAAAAAITAGGARAQAGTRLRCYWWGNPDRDKRTRAALDAYQAKNPGTQVASESVGWGDYWTKLATQTAGGSPPDLIQMDYRYIFEYSRRGTLLDLGSVSPKPLDLSTFDKNTIDSGRVDGKLFGISLGANSKSTIYDTEMYAKAGVAKLDPKWTWDDLTRIAAEISKINPGKYWGTSDNSRQEQGFEHWLNQRDKQLYSADGKATFTADDVAQWFDIWDKLRKAGSCPPADVGALNNGGIDQSEVTKGLSATGYANSNQIVAFQAINKAKLSISLFPNQPGGKSGHYIKPSQFISVSARSANKEEAAKVVQFLVNETDGVKALGIERGVPGSSSAQKVLLPDLDALGKLQVDFVADTGKIAVPLPPPPPKGAGEIEVLLRRVADTVAFGRASVKDGAQQFFNEATAILARG